MQDNDINVLTKNSIKNKEDIPPCQNICLLLRRAEKFQKKIIQEVCEIIEELRKDKEAQLALETWLNKTQDNVIAKLRREHPELKEEEIKLFCYIKADFTPTMMSVLLRKDKSVIYNRVSRLKAKVYK